MLSVSLQIDHKRKSQPLHEQISDAIEKAIARGAHRGTRLPSVRGLSKRLNVSPSTVTAAYRTLVSRHLVEASARSGFIVAAESRIRTAQPGFPLDKIEPNLKHHPIAEFGRLVAEVAASDDTAGGYGDYRSDLGLREQLAILDAEAGIKADPAMDILVTSGSQQAIALVAQMIGPGARVAIEDPTYPGVHLAFQQSGAKLLAIPAKQDGPDMKILETASDSIDLFYCCPTYANPTGQSWSIRTRERVAALALRKGFVLFEDDYLGDLDYLDENLPRLKALAPEAKIIHARTFSKCLIPALRIAGVTADPHTIDLLLNRKLAADIVTSLLLQRALALFIERGAYRDLLNRVRPFYKSVRDALRTELNKSDSGIAFGAPPAGLSLFAELPDQLDAIRYAAECERLGVRINPGRDYFLDPHSGASAFRICFGGIEPTDASTVVKALDRACERTIGSGRSSLA